MTDQVVFLQAGKDADGGRLVLMGQVSGRSGEYWVVNLLGISLYYNGIW